MQENRTYFSSKLGLLLATAGSAVGLGNIWRFPVITGQNGGAAFLIIYFICVLLIGIPLMTAEFVVGRSAHTNTATAYTKLTNNRFFKHLGQLGVFTGWFILCYYIVVSAWTLNYLIDSIRGTFVALGETGDSEVYKNYFQNFVTNPWKPLLLTVVFILCSHFVIVKGVKSGIEKFSKLLMPSLFVVLFILVVCSFFTEGSTKGLNFLFYPDFSKITFNSVLMAVGQAFFSMSIAMGCVCTYASYFNSETKLVNTAVKVSLIDSVVALMSGMIIFPAVFSTAIPVDSGASLVFVALPEVFQKAFGSHALLGQLVSILFYFLLVIATLTSVISLHEVPSALLRERFHLSPQKAATIVTISVIIWGSLCSLSMGALDNLTLCGKNLFDLFDLISGEFLLPVGGILISLFVGWFLDKKVIYSEITNHGKVSKYFYKPILLSLKYFVPIAILFVLLKELGVL